MNKQKRGEEIARQLQEVMAGFNNTCCKGKTYNEKEIATKNKWLMKFNKAKNDWDQWLGTCRSIS